mmetsp:Transcript_71422/g.172892  ORF Transcript_71422/g.172892 Transcript_71422/m.172892 type:complete len:209 (-) Transcript_71422:65-691(-)
MACSAGVKGDLRPACGAPRIPEGWTLRHPPVGTSVVKSVSAWQDHDVTAVFELVEADGTFFAIASTCKIPAKALQEVVWQEVVKTSARWHGRGGPVDSRSRKVSDRDQADGVLPELCQYRTPTSPSAVHCDTVDGYDPIATGDLHRWVLCIPTGHSTPSIHTTEHNARPVPGQADTQWDGAVAVQRQVDLPLATHGEGHHAMCLASSH